MVFHTKRIFFIQIACFMFLLGKRTLLAPNLGEKDSSVTTKIKKDTSVMQRTLLSTKGHFCHPFSSHHFLLIEKDSSVF